MSAEPMNFSSSPLSKTQNRAQQGSGDATEPVQRASLDFMTTASGVGGAGASGLAKTRKVPTGNGIGPSMSASTSGRSNAPSRYLVTVLPPAYLPHDPPHPRTSSLCSGYGPPSKFRRGTLVPLYPTLPAQLAAIAREYGLPSTGGLALYLVELNQEQNAASQPLSEALLGGPRIGEEAWALLWDQLFAAEEPPFSEEDDDAESSDALATVSQALGRRERGAATPSEPLSDVSSSISMGDSASVLMQHGHSADTSAIGQNTSHFSSSSGASPFSSSTRFPKSSSTSHTTVEYFDSSSPQARPQSSASRGKMRSHRLGSTSRQAVGLNHKASRASLASNRSYSHSIASQDRSKAYGSALIVGKLEFDIDRGRGGGKWFDSWLESANAPEANTPAFPRGGVRHPESQLGSLLRSRIPSNEPASPKSFQLSASSAAPASTNASSRLPSPSPLLSSMSRQASGSPIRSSQSQHVESSTSANMALTSSQLSTTSATDRRSVASSSIGPVLDDERRQSAASSTRAIEDGAATPSSISAEQRSQASSRLSRSSSLAVSATGAESLPEGEEAQQPRSASRQSDHSSLGNTSGSGQLVDSRARFDMLNATPRVRPPRAFEQRPASPHGDRSPQDLSPTPISPNTAPQVLTGFPDAVAASGMQDSRSQDVIRSSFATDSSGPSRRRQESAISSRSRASSASFEAVSEDGDIEAAAIVDGAYQPLADADDDPDARASTQDEREGRHRSHSVSESSRYGQDDEVGEVPDVSHPLSKDPLRDVFGSDAATWAGMRSQEASSDSARAQSPAGHAEEPSPPPSGLGITSPGLHPMAIPNSASSASFDPFEYDNEAQSPSALSATGEDADVEEVVDLLKTHHVGKEQGLSSPIHLGESNAVMASTADEATQSAAGQNEFVAAIDERRSSVNHARTASIASSSYSRRAHSRKSSSISSLRHSRAGSTTSDSKRLPALSAITSPTPAEVALPESDSAYSLASTTQSYPSISEPASEYSMPVRAGNRTAGLPTDWANQLSALPGVRSRANTDTSTPAIINEHGDDTILGPDDTEHLGVRSRQASNASTGDGDAFLTPNNARDSISSLAEPQISRSRSSSVEMADNLDDLEKALLELSPRAVKNSRQEIMPMPDLRPMFALNRAVAVTPGYEAKSELEAAAPSTPVASTDVVKEESLSPAGEMPSGQAPKVSALPPRGASLPSAPATAQLPTEDSPTVPPLPLNIRPRETPLSPDAVSVASTTLQYASHATPLPTPPLHNATMGEVQEPTPVQLAQTEPRREVTFAPSPQKATPEEPPTSARSVGSRFAGASLKLKNWSGKSKTEREEASMPQSAPAASQAQGNGENKSPLGGFKGLSFWRQKDAEDSYQVGDHPATMSPSSSQMGSSTTPSSGGRIPRKSSLASLKSAMTHRSDASTSPGLSAAPQVPLPSPANTSYSAFPSPPTHTSLPSPANRAAEFPSFMPSFPPPPALGSARTPGTPPALYRGGSTTTSGDSPQSQRAGIGLNSMHDLPAFSSIHNRRDLDSTPDMADLAGPRFMGQHGRSEGHISSAPVTPAYAEPSLVSSSGRLGKPVKANAAKFRLSADADLTKMMSHMQAIEFGEDYAPVDTNIPSDNTGPAALAGLGLGLPKSKRT